MSSRGLLIVAGAAGAMLLSGCEIILPIIAATQGGTSYDPYSGDPYYDPYYYYGDGGYPDYRYETLNVEIEELSGRVLGRELAPSLPGLTVGGHHSGQSAQFALTVAEDPEQPEPTPSTDDLIVTLDVCPIEDYASGAPIPSPEGYVFFTVCRGYDCLHSYDGTLDVSVNEDADGRHVVARSRWSGGDELALRVRYTVADDSGSVAP